MLHGYTLVKIKNAIIDFVKWRKLVLIGKKDVTLKNQEQQWCDTVLTCANQIGR